MKVNRERGSALITAIIISVILAMLLASSLTVALTSISLGTKQIDAQVAIQIADAGINSELQKVKLSSGLNSASQMSSQPVVYPGVTATLPNGDTVIGRPGSVTGYPNGEFYVYSSNDSTGIIPWDGMTSPFYITSYACVNKVWESTQVQTTTKSIFNSGGSGTTDPGTGTKINPSPSCTNTPCSDVEFTGSYGTNGSVYCGQNCNLHASTCINWNSSNATNQLGSNNSSQVFNIPSLTIYPKTSDACRSCFGISRSGSGSGCSGDYSDSAAFSICKANSYNSFGVYQYKQSAQSATICPQNCTKYYGCGYSLNNWSFGYANYKPGTFIYNNPVQTLIFEPGDYYFTSINLAYEASCEMICDCGALASGGTPGQVRFWVYDPGYNPQSDYIQLPITSTCAAGESTPDTGKFRIYYAKDGCALSFTRPPNIQDCTGKTITGDFDYYCGVYACTKPANDTSCSQGTTVSINGTCLSTATPGKGCCNFHGSLICDNLNCSGACNIQYIDSNCTDKDLTTPSNIISWSCSRN